MSAPIVKVLSFRNGFSREEPAVLWSGNGVREALLHLHHGEQEPRALCRRDGISHGAGLAAQGWRGWSVYAEVSRASACLLSKFSERGRRTRAGDGDQEVATGEEGGIDSRGQPDVGGSGSGVGRGSGDEGVRESRFLASLGMTTRGSCLDCGPFLQNVAASAETTPPKPLAIAPLPHKSYRTWLGWGAVTQAMSRTRRTARVRCYNAAHGRPYFEGPSGRIQPVAFAQINQARSIDRRCHRDFS